MRLFALFASLVLASSASAQAPCDAGCDLVVEGSDRRIDGSDVAPGDTVCVRGGTIPTLAISDVHGSTAAPVTIRACDAPLVIGEGSATNGIGITRSSHLRVTGGAELSIRIVGGASYSVGVAVGTCTDHLEVDGLEVSGTSYTAYRNLSESDECTVRDGFSLHDWFIHDVGGEGMFFGANSSSTPYHLTGVEVWGNRIERTGMQGIKIGTSVQDAHVHDNVVIDAGARDIAGEDTGISGGARSWRIERNVIVRSSASCAFVSGSEVTLANNVMIGCGTTAISMNGAAPIRARIVHNTIVAPMGGVLNMWASAPMDSALGNNLLVDFADATALGVRDGGAWSVGGNLAVAMDGGGFLTTIDPATAGFDDLVPAPFAIAETSPAVDVGLTTFLGDVDDDIAGAPRDASPDVGAHEVAAPVVDAGTTPDGGVEETDGGAVADAGATERDGAVGRDAGGTMASAGGCSAGHGGASFGGWAVLALLALRRR